MNIKKAVTQLQEGVEVSEVVDSLVESFRYKDGYELEPYNFKMLVDWEEEFDYKSDMSKGDFLAKYEDKFLDKRRIKEDYKVSKMKSMIPSNAVVISSEDDYQVNQDVVSAISKGAKRGDFYYGVTPLTFKGVKILSLEDGAVPYRVGAGYPESYVMSKSDFMKLKDMI